MVTLVKESRRAFAEHGSGLDPRVEGRGGDLLPLAESLRVLDDQRRVKRRPVQGAGVDFFVLSRSLKLSPSWL